MRWWQKGGKSFPTTDFYGVGGHPKLWVKIGSCPHVRMLKYLWNQHLYYSRCTGLPKWKPSSSWPQFHWGVPLFWISQQNEPIVLNALESHHLLCWDAHLDIQCKSAVQVEATCYLATYWWWFGKPYLIVSHYYAFPQHPRSKWAGLIFTINNLMVLNDPFIRPQIRPYFLRGNPQPLVHCRIFRRFVLRNTTFQQPWIIFTKLIDTYQDRSIPTKTDPPPFTCQL